MSRAGLGLGGVAAGLAYRQTRAVLDRFLPKPSEGPTPELRGTAVMFGQALASQSVQPMSATALHG